MGNQRATRGFQRDLKAVTFGKYLYPQQVRPFAPGIEIIGIFTGVIQGFLGGEKALKYSGLIFPANPDPIITHFQDAPLSFGFNDNLYFAFIGRVFNGVFQQAVKYLLQRIRGQVHRRAGFKITGNVNLTMGKRGFQNLKSFLNEDIQGNTFRNQLPHTEGILDAISEFLNQRAFSPVVPNGPGNRDEDQPGFDDFDVRNEVFDGGYEFGPQVDCPGGICPAWATLSTGLTDIGFINPGDYVVEVVAPPGYEILKPEDKNVDFGDVYEPAPELLPAPCVGDDALIPPLPDPLPRRTDRVALRVDGRGLCADLPAALRQEGGHALRGRQRRGRLLALHRGTRGRPRLRLHSR